MLHFALDLLAGFSNLVLDTVRSTTPPVPERVAREHRWQAYLRTPTYKTCSLAVLQGHRPPVAIGEFPEIAEGRRRLKDWALDLFDRLDSSELGRLGVSFQSLAVDDFSELFWDSYV